MAPAASWLQLVYSFDFSSSFKKRLSSRKVDDFTADTDAPGTGILPGVGQRSGYGHAGNRKACNSKKQPDDRHMVFHGVQDHGGNVQIDQVLRH